MRMILSAISTMSAT